MIVGIPKEIKAQENRVAAMPAGVKALKKAGHQILVEAGAGEGSGISDDEFQAAGAEICAGAAEIWRRSEMVIKVKEPLPPEYPFLHEGLVVFTFLHLAPSPELTNELLKSKVRAVAYETVMEPDGSLPMLAPMSAVAGRLAVQMGAHYLEKESGGRGVLLGGVPGAEPGRVVILGNGTVGRNAAEVAVGMGAKVTVLGRNSKKLAGLAEGFGVTINTMVSSQENIFKMIRSADLVVGAVLVPGGRAPVLVTREMLGSMRRGAVIVDVAIDQGGCCETSRPTTHKNPVYEEEGILHYCVANMPGAVPMTSTQALASATLPFALEIAGKGLRKAAFASRALRLGLNTWDGLLVSREVAQAQGRKWTDSEDVMQ